MWTHTHMLLSAKSKNTTLSETVWRPREVLISLWSLLISVLVCFTIERCHICFSVPLFYLSSCLSLISLPLPPHTTRIRRYHSADQMAAPSENKTLLCVCIFYILWKRGCVCLCNICWAQWKTLMCVGEGVINKYHKWLLCVPIFPRRRVENKASVSAEVLQGWYRNLLRATDQVRFWLLWRLTTLVYSVWLCKPPKSPCFEMHNAKYVSVSIPIIAVTRGKYDPEACDWKSAVFESEMSCDQSLWSHRIWHLDNTDWLKARLVR